MPAEIEFPDIPLHAVLTKDEVASLLRVDERTIERSDIPYFFVVEGGRERRYSWRQVLDHMEKRARNTAAAA